MDHCSRCRECTRMFFVLFHIALYYTVSSLQYEHDSTDSPAYLLNFTPNFASLVRHSLLHFHLSHMAVRHLFHHLYYHHFHLLLRVQSFILNLRLGSLANPFHRMVDIFPNYPRLHGFSDHLTFFFISLNGWICLRGVLD